MIGLHEFCWLAFLVTVLLRGTILAEAPMAWQLAIAWLALLTGFAWAYRRTRDAPMARSRWGWAYYAIALNIAFPLLGPTIKGATSWRADALLFQIDGSLIGENLSLRLEPWIAPAISDLMSLGYMSFMLLLYGSLIFYLFRSPHLARCYRGLFSIYGLGFMGYALLPAAGPYIALADRFTTPIQGGWLTSLNERMVMTGSNHVDVFPSLHVAVSLFLWLTLIKDHRKLGLAITPIVVVLWVSTIYLRYHYFVDVIAGGALGAGSFLLTAPDRERSGVGMPRDSILPTQSNEP